MLESSAIWCKSGHPRATRANFYASHPRGSLDAIMPCFHIRWHDSKLDWECHRTEAEDESRAKELASSAKHSPSKDSTTLTVRCLAQIRGPEGARNKLVQDRSNLHPVTSHPIKPPAPTVRERRYFVPSPTSATMANVAPIGLARSCTTTSREKARARQILAAIIFITCMLLRLILQVLHSCGATRWHRAPHIPQTRQ